MTEWCQFMSELTTNNTELVIVGDINIHLDNTSLCHTQNFMKSLEATGLQQHIQEPTHYIGHTLDVLISRDDSTLLSNISVVDIGLCNKEGKLTGDHYATVFSINTIIMMNMDEHGTIYLKHPYGTSDVILILQKLKSAEKTGI